MWIEPAKASYGDGFGLWQKLWQIVALFIRVVFKKSGQVVIVSFVFRNNLFKEAIQYNLQVFPTQYHLKVLRLFLLLKSLLIL